MQLVVGSIVEVIPAREPRDGADRKLGILVRPEPQPDERWLREQRDERWRAHQGAPWWAVMPLTGGMLLVPEPLIRFVRDATDDDILTAVDHATNHGRRYIGALYPKFVAKIAEAAGRSDVGDP